jgi:hypothetical protein
MLAPSSRWNPLHAGDKLDSVPLEMEAANLPRNFEIFLTVLKPKKDARFLIFCVRDNIEISRINLLHEFIVPLCTHKQLYVFLSLLVIS